MLLRGIFIVLFSLANLLSFSQSKLSDYDMVWGAEEPISKRQTLSDIVGYDDNGFYALKISRKVNYSIGLMNTFRSPLFTLERYNHDVKKTMTSEINLKQFGEKRMLEEVIQLKDKLYLFSSYDDNSSKKNILYTQPIDMKTLKPGKNARKLAEINFKGHKRKNSGVHGFKMSRDRSKLLVYNLLPYEKNESEKFGFKVFDDEMTLLWEKEVVLPYTDQLFGVEHFQIDDRGNVYLLGLVYKEKRKKKRGGKPNYRYNILAYQNGGKSVQEYPVSIPGKFITDMQISIDDNGDIICGGFYSEEGTFSIKGTYFLTVDGKSKQIKNKSLKEFDIDFIVQNFTRKEEKKARKKAEKGNDIELYYYDLDEIILKESGGAVLVAEQYSVVRHTSQYTDANGIRQSSSYTNYHYNDIIVVNIDASGQIVWANKIPKKQITRNDGGYHSSYVLSVVKDKLYFVFNDNPKNLVIEKEGKLKNIKIGKEAMAVIVEIDMEGNQKKKALFSARNSEAVARPKVCRQASDNVVIIFCERNKKHRFAKLSL